MSGAPRTLPALPFVEWLRRYAKGRAPGEPARLLGLNADQVSRYLRGIAYYQDGKPVVVEDARVLLRTVDRALTAAGVLLWDVYPDLFGAGRRKDAKYPPRRKSWCTRCQDWKPMERFTPVAYGEDGTVLRVLSRCKSCLAEQGRERRREDPEWAERVYRRDWERISSNSRKAAQRRVYQRENSRLFRAKQRGRKEQRILELLRRGDGWLTAAELAEGIGAPSERSIRSALGELEERGVLERREVRNHWCNMVREYRVLRELGEEAA